MNAGGNRLIITFTKGHLSKLKKKILARVSQKHFAFYILCFQAVLEVTSILHISKWSSALEKSFLKYPE